LKTLRLRSTAAADKESSIRRLINEGNAISQLNHPNIVNFIEFGYSGTGTGRMPYIVMEYFPGKSLKYYLENPMELSIKKKIKIIIQIADALQAAHTKNIFHRDIKPDNILVDKKLNVKLTDFGICHLPTSDVTRTSELMGSPGYMAPEYLQYGKTDKLMDIYSLGVVSYELFVGVRPFDANNLTELMNKIIKKHPAEPRKLVPDFPEKLQDIIAKMMKKNPKRRYNDASEIIDELNKVLEESPETGFFKRTITKIFYKDWN
jgi:serine/threonine-protein kinase